jgi:hypothetical protein
MAPTSRQYSFGNITNPSGIPTTISLRSKPKICMTDRDAQDSGASEQGFIAKEDE